MQHTLKIIPLVDSNAPPKNLIFNNLDLQSDGLLGVFRIKLIDFRVANSRQNPKNIRYDFQLKRPKKY